MSKNVKAINTDRKRDLEERLASIRAQIQQSIDDPRPSLSINEARANLRGHIQYLKSL